MPPVAALRALLPPDVDLDGQLRHEAARPVWLGVVAELAEQAAPLCADPRLELGQAHPVEVRPGVVAPAQPAPHHTEPHRTRRLVAQLTVEVHVRG